MREGYHVCCACHQSGTANPCRPSQTSAIMVRWPSRSRRRRAASMAIQAVAAVSPASKTSVVQGCSVRSSQTSAGTISAVPVAAGEQQNERDQRQESDQPERPGQDFVGREWHAAGEGIEQRARRRQLAHGRIVIVERPGNISL